MQNYEKPYDWQQKPYYKPFAKKKPYSTSYNFDAYLSSNFDISRNSYFGINWTFFDVNWDAYCGISRDSYCGINYILVSVGVISVASEANSMSMEVTPASVGTLTSASAVFYFDVGSVISISAGTLTFTSTGMLTAVSA